MRTLACSILLDRQSPAIFASLHSGNNHVLFLLLLFTEMSIRCDKPDRAICGRQMLVLCNMQKKIVWQLFHSAAVNGKKGATM